ncbi:MAG: hypothetical protein JSS65_13170 [Armatimonadetes bacterium]|nr:hypothetical protein [Armatimonadota bacterium]
MRALAAALLVGLVTVPALAGQAEADFTWKPKVGQVRKYKLNVAMNTEIGGQALDIKVSMVNVGKVTKIDGEKLTLEAHVEDFKLNFNGNETEPPTDGANNPAAVKAIIVQNLKTGETISRETEGGESPVQQSQRVENISVFWRPTGKVKVGESWTKELKKDDKKQTPAALSKYTVVGEEEAEGHKCWKVTFAFSEIGIDKPFGATGTYWIDQAEGSPVRMTADYENVQFNEMMPPTNAKVSMVLLP